MARRVTRPGAFGAGPLSVDQLEVNDQREVVGAECRAEPALTNHQRVAMNKMIDRDTEQRV
jgi:hypothetical protein